MASENVHSTKHILLKKYRGIHIKLKDGLDSIIKQILNDYFRGVWIRVF